MSIEDLMSRFRHHTPPTPAAAEPLAKIRGECLDLAQFLNELVPEGREKSLAITHLEEVMFWANAAIARQWP